MSQNFKNDYWDRLLVYLNEWADARVAGLGRIELTLEREHGGGSQKVTIEMTKTEWLEIVSIPWGWDFDLAAEEVRKAVSGVGPEGRLIVGQYELTTP